MKKILIILLLIFSSNIFAKEYTSSVHNLKITLPDSYTILNSTNIAEVYKNIEGRVPKETLEQMVLNYKNILSTHITMKYKIFSTNKTYQRYHTNSVIPHLFTNLVVVR